MKSAMRHIKTYILILAGFLASVTSCKEEGMASEVPTWETAVHGYGVFAPNSPQNFVFQNPAIDIDFNLQWVSIDSKNSVTKIEVFVLFNEPFTDPDDNLVTAKHGGDDGKLYATYEGSEIPANRT